MVGEWPAHLRPWRDDRAPGLDRRGRPDPGNQPVPGIWRHGNGSDSVWVRFWTHDSAAHVGWLGGRYAFRYGRWQWLVPRDIHRPADRRWIARGPGSIRRGCGDQYDEQRQRRWL